jgi:hypothetical protein
MTSQDTLQMLKWGKSGRKTHLTHSRWTCASRSISNNKRRQAQSPRDISGTSPITVDHDAIVLLTIAPSKNSDMPILHTSSHILGLRYQEYCAPCRQ